MKKKKTQETAIKPHLSKDLTALLIFCNRSTSPLSNRSNSLFNLSCGARDPSLGSSLTEAVRGGLEGLETGSGCFLAAFAPT